jgi:putative oxidoreductase
LQRLFSTFPNNWPGAGLLLLRIAAGVPLILEGISEILRAPRPVPFIVAGAATVTGAFLLVGLWTPLSGALAVFIQLWMVISHTGHRGVHALLVALAASLMMLGPGAWSIDARLFGRKRIELQGRQIRD